MILVDTSVWIEFFNASAARPHLVLHNLLEAEEDVGLADIILTEILQGIKSEKSFRATKRYLLEFPIYSLKGISSYVEAAQIYRLCRRRGHTIRRSIDCIIAMVAIENDLALFHNDKDFQSIASVVDDLKIYEY